MPPEAPVRGRGGLAGSDERACGARTAAAAGRLWRRCAERADMYASWIAVETTSRTLSVSRSGQVATTNAASGAATLAASHQRC